MAAFNLDEQYKLQNSDEKLGAFAGYIRRPEPSSSGMTAQFFGEDGADADTILALSLTKFKDLKVFVSVYLVKDSVGMPMKKDGKYPLICSFIGRVRRSKPKPDGMLANIFAENGTDSDQVAEMTKSEYQNCLVFVDIRGIKAYGQEDKINFESQSAISEGYAKRLSKAERQEMESLERKYAKKNELLTPELLSKVEVLDALGNPEDFKQWLEHQPCAHRQPDHCLNKVIVAKIDGLFEPYNYLPSCADHIADMETYEHFNDDMNRMHYEMRHRYLLASYAKKKIYQKFCDDGFKEPNPAKVIEWAAANGIIRHFNPKYVAVV